MKGPLPGAERRALRAQRQAAKKAKARKNETRVSHFDPTERQARKNSPKVEQFKSVFPNTHPDVAGVGRTLSRGISE